MSTAHRKASRYDFLMPAKLIIYSDFV